MYKTKIKRELIKIKIKINLENLVVLRINIIPRTLTRDIKFKLNLDLFKNSVDADRATGYFNLYREGGHFIFGL